MPTPVSVNICLQIQTSMPLPIALLWALAKFSTYAVQQETPPYISFPHNELTGQTSHCSRKFCDRSSWECVAALINSVNDSDIVQQLCGQFVLREPHVLRDTCIRHFSFDKNCQIFMASMTWLTLHSEWRRCAFVIHFDILVLRDKLAVVFYPRPLRQLFLQSESFENFLLKYGRYL